MKTLRELLGLDGDGDITNEVIEVYTKYALYPNDNYWRYPENIARDAEVLYQRFALNKTYKEIGKTLFNSRTGSIGMSSSAVACLERKAIRRLRSPRLRALIREA